MTALEYRSSITQDIDVIVKQIWNGAPKKKRQGDLIELDIASAVTSIETEDTIEGSSTLTIALVDQNWRLLESGFFDPDSDGDLDPIEVNYPQGSRFWWRLANCDVTSELHAITLTFIERAVALLMAHKGVKKASRATMTRAQFMKSLVDEVKKVKLEFKCRELKAKQKIAKPDATTLADTAGPGDFTKEREAQRKREEDKKADKDPGIAKGAYITIKGITANDDQIDAINRVLGAAAELDPSPKTLKSLVCANIGESSYNIEALNKKSKAHGVYQLLPDTERNIGIKYNDLEALTEYFLKTGFWVKGGAIKLAKENPSKSAGWISNCVEGAYSNLDEGARFYDAFGDEADAIIEEFGPGGSGGSSGDREPYRKQFNFSRDKGEDSWEAMTRLAEEVKWPLFVDGNRIYFDSDLTLIKQKPAARINRNDKEVVSWGYTVALRKFATEMSITLICDPDEFRAGEVFKLEHFGMASGGKYKGKWLITNIQRNRADISSVFTLRLPITPTLEPAPDIGGTSSSDSGGGSDDEGTLAAGIKASAVSTSGGGAWGAGRSYGGHAGVDISMPEGTKLLACCSGTVACVSKGWYGSTNGKGQGMISIKSDSKVGGFPAGTIFGYGHPDVIYLKKGDKVKAGDKLALSGSPGGGAHLHFFINTAGEACGNGNTNPTKFAKDALSRG